MVLPLKKCDFQLPGEFAGGVNHNSPSNHPRRSHLQLLNVLPEIRPQHVAVPSYQGDTGRDLGRSMGGAMGEPLR